MKKKLLTLVLPLLAVFMSYSQAELTVTAPAATTGTGARAPGGTNLQTTLRGVQIVTAAELASIPNGTTISKLSFLLTVGATPGPAGGNIKFYLENTADVTNLKSTAWATAIGTMTNVYDGAYSIPAVAGQTADLTLSTGFVYTGGSIYVAYDYLGTTFTGTGATYAANSSITGGWKGDYNATTTPAATLTLSSSFRPSIRFTFVNPFTNELNVSGVAGEKGIFNNTIKTTQVVTSVIMNTSVGALTNVPVTLTVTGANPFTATQIISSIASGGSSTLLFNNVPTINLGSQTLTISIPADEQPGNNSRTFTQLVQCDTIGYTQSPVQSGGLGFNTGAGLIAVKHVLPNTIETFVKSVSNYFPTDVSNSGNTLRGILMNGNGTIIDSTALITITAGMLGTKQNFNFLNGTVSVAGSTIYVGFRQTANATTGYFPFGSQDNSYVDPNAAATFPLYGGTPAPLGSSLGYMMIDATLNFGSFEVANNSTGGNICSNSTVNILPTPGYNNYEFFVNSSSLQNGSTSTYTTGPLTTSTTYNVSITNGTCILNSATQTVNIISPVVNDISAEICPGQSYVVGTSTYTTGGNYSDVLVSSNGCDSTVNLTLSNLVPTASTINESICQGQTFTFGSQTPSTDGTYSRTITNVAGCDSVITLNLTVNPSISAVATISGSTLTATPAADSYQWIDCVTDLPISGATASTFSPTINGTYAVIAETNLGCSDTSNCIILSTIGLDELENFNSINLFPNPAVNEIHAVSQNTKISGYSVTDIKGKVMFSITEGVNLNEINISIDKFEMGTYFIAFKTTNGIVYKSFVKQ